MTEDVTPKTEQQVENKEKSKRSKNKFTFGLNFLFIVLAWDFIGFICKLIPKDPDVLSLIIAIIAIIASLYLIGIAIYENIEVIIEMCSEKIAEKSSKSK
jgi:biotin transporter BioY